MVIHSSFFCPTCQGTEYIRYHTTKYFSTHTLTHFTFKDHISTNPQRKLITKIVVVYNHSLWMTRQWLRTHVNPSRLNSMTNFVISKFKDKFNTL